MNMAASKAEKGWMKVAKAFVRSPAFWFLASFVVMIGIAFPQCRSPSYAGLSFRYAWYSIQAAFWFPIIGLAVFFPFFIRHTTWDYLVWVVLLLPLAFGRWLYGKLAAYVALIILWVLYCIGWVLAH